MESDKVHGVDDRRMSDSSEDSMIIKDEPKVEESPEYEVEEVWDGTQWHIIKKTVSSTVTEQEQEVTEEQLSAKLADQQEAEPQQAPRFGDAGLVANGSRPGEDDQEGSQQAASAGLDDVQDGEGAIVPSEEGDMDEAAGGEMQSTRLVMKKQVHKKTIVRDGKEETIVTEDTHVEQDNEGPDELREDIQNIVDQFMTGQGDVG